MLLCHTGLALSSSVAGVGVSLSSVSFLLRSSLVIFISVCLFVLGYFVVRAFDYTLCVLLRIRACTCAVSFMLNFVSCLLESNFIFFVLWLSILLKFIWYGHHHPRHVLVASYSRRLPLAPKGSSSPAVCDLRFRCCSQIKNSQLTNQKTASYALVYGSPKGYTTTTPVCPSMLCIFPDSTIIERWPLLLLLFPVQFPFL